MTEEKINQAVLQVSELIEKHITTEFLKEQIKAVLESEVGQLYFLAPASSRVTYHSCYPGGLAHHSVNVFKSLQKLNMAFNQGFTNEKMLLTALFHDFGKACKPDLKSPHYVPSTERWQKEKGYLYQYDDEGSTFFTTHQRTLFILQSLGFQLEPDVYQAILLNDGQYIQENKAYAMKECPLALFLHTADRIACNLEK